MNLPEETLRIDTPENVTFGYEIGGIGSRFLAALVDTLLIVLLQIVVFLGIALLTAAMGGQPAEADATMVTWIAAVGGLISFAFLWGYYIFFEMLWNGQSPGKRMVGLRVIRTDGSPVTLIESIVRNLVRLIDFLPVFYGVGVVVRFVNEQSRRRGDLAAGTLGVFDRSPVTLASLEKKLAQPEFAGLDRVEASAWPVERLSQADLQLAGDFIRRREELFNRADLSEQIAAVLFERMDVPAPPLRWPAAERLIMEIVQTALSRQAGE
jgi:uncharacterized RDD family membrane protein YckC